MEAAEAFREDLQSGEEQWLDLLPRMLGALRSGPRGNPPHGEGGRGRRAEVGRRFGLTQAAVLGLKRPCVELQNRGHSSSIWMIYENGTCSEQACWVVRENMDLP